MTKKMNDRFYNAYQIPGFLLFSIVLFIGLGSVNGLEQKIFENKEMGLKFNYPSDWVFGFVPFTPPSSCQYQSCTQELIWRDKASFGNEYGDSGGVTIIMASIDSAGCNCSSLDEFVKWIYNDLKDGRGFVFISDSQTFVDGYPARLINYNTSNFASFSFIYPLEPFTITDVFVKSNNAFYRLIFFGLGGYSVLQEDFDTIMKSIEFLPLQTKTPSFLK